MPKIIITLPEGIDADNVKVDFQSDEEIALAEKQAGGDVEKTNSDQAAGKATDQDAEMNGEQTTADEESKPAPVNAGTSSNDILTPPTPAA